MKEIDKNQLETAESWKKIYIQWFQDLKKLVVVGTLAFRKFQNPASVETYFVNNRRKIKFWTKVPEEFKKDMEEFPEIEDFQVRLKEEYDQV